MRQQETIWTEEVIANRLVEAARTMSRLPAVKAQGYVSTWPEMVYTEREQLQMELKSKPWPATHEQVTRMEEACQWLWYLENLDDRKLLWLRAEFVRWQFICAKFGVSRATANRRWKNGLFMIAHKLNRA